MEIQGLGISGLSLSSGSSRRKPTNSSGADNGAMDQTARSETGEASGRVTARGLFQGSQVEGLYEDADETSDEVSDEEDEEMASPTFDEWFANRKQMGGSGSHAFAPQANHDDKGKGVEHPDDIPDEKVIAARILLEMRSNDVGDGQRENTYEKKMVAFRGIIPDAGALITSLTARDEDVLDAARMNAKHSQLDSNGQVIAPEIEEQDFFTALTRYPELLIEIAMCLPLEEFVSLYAISKGFNESMNAHLSYILPAYAAIHYPGTGRIFVFNVYALLCRVDPVGRPDGTWPYLDCLVPSFRWLRMVKYRHKVVRDILACMAREGFRMPKTMHLSLKKMWLTMDIATSARRVQLMHNEEYWTDFDLYNIQMFSLKLDMRFNYPEGPGDDGLKKLMMGQRGLTPLWKLLKRTDYKSIMEVFQAAVRYCYVPERAYEHLSAFGVAPHLVGKGHLEGWGRGRIHLYRIDELVMREAGRRNLNFESFLLNMMVWGYVDAKTGRDIEVTEEEQYMSDDSDSESVADDCSFDEGDSSDDGTSSDGRDSPDSDSRYYGVPYFGATSDGGGSSDTEGHNPNSDGYYDEDSEDGADDGDGLDDGGGDGQSGTEEGAPDDKSEEEGDQDDDMSEVEWA